MAEQYAVFVTILSTIIFVLILIIIICGRSECIELPSSIINWVEENR